MRAISNLEDADHFDPLTVVAQKEIHKPADDLMRLCVAPVDYATGQSFGTIVST
jgi:hypothetical protein